MKARKLRKAGKAIKVIAKQLHVSPGSVHRWCHDIQLTDAQKLKMDNYCKAVQMKFLRQHVEQKKLEARCRTAHYHSRGSARVGDLSARDLLMLGLGLYWGEGTKRDRSSVSLSNMDPNALRLFIAWLRLIGAPMDGLDAWLHIAEGSDVRREVRWWAQQLGLPADKIRTTVKLTPTSLKKIRREAYHGCLALRIFRTNLMSEVSGMLNAVAKHPYGDSNPD